jgi:hypothetical protein
VCIDFSEHQRRNSSGAISLTEPLRDWQHEQDYRRWSSDLGLLQHYSATGSGEDENRPLELYAPCTNNRRASSDNGSMSPLPQLRELVLLDSNRLSVDDLNRRNSADGESLRQQLLQQERGHLVISQDTRDGLRVPDTAYRRNSSGPECLLGYNKTKTIGSALPLTSDGKCLSVPDMQRQPPLTFTFDLDKLLFNAINASRHLAVPESSDIDMPEDELDSEERISDEKPSVEKSSSSDAYDEYCDVVNVLVERENKCSNLPFPFPGPSSDRRVSECRLVQFNTRVKVEGDSENSQTSNSLKPGEDESNSQSLPSGEGTTTLGTHTDSYDDDEYYEYRYGPRKSKGRDSPTTCCGKGLTLNCLTAPRLHRSKRGCKSPLGVEQQQHQQHLPQPPTVPLHLRRKSPPPPLLTIEPPVIYIRKDSVSQFMSECPSRGAPTPSFHSFSASPSTTTTTTSGTYKSDQSGHQLTVPTLGAPLSPPPPQRRGSQHRHNGHHNGGGNGATKSRSNNNTKRARNREKEKQRREKLEMQRERKAARVLGIITGAFVVCWLPFFIVALAGPFLIQCCGEVPPIVFSLFLWLGYFNSLLNPIIYTVFNPSFRTAFRKIFFRRLRSVTR